MKIKANNDLFERWRLLGSRIIALSSIVQNDMDVTEAQVEGWIENVRLLGKEYRQLAGDILDYINWDMLEEESI